MPARARRRPTFVLIHSPLVGPLSWESVAAELRRREVAAVVPSLLPALAGDPPYAPRFAATVSDAVAGAALDAGLILAGHSAAGQYLPAVRAALPRDAAACLYVDSARPARDRTLLENAPPEFAALVRELSDGASLPPWSEWFGPDAMRVVLPDATVRARFVAELPRVPLALFEERLAWPAGLPVVPSGYLQLSAGYGADAEQARARGWPLRALDGSHLQMLVDPGAVADALLRVADDVLP